MGIINVTRDSFYSGSRVTPGEVSSKCREMISAGADIIDIGACSTRPGAAPTEETHETDALISAISIIKDDMPDSILSVDTYRPSVARKCVEAGADIINDVSGGCDEMFSTVAELKVPYVLTHNRGNSQTMQSKTDYEDVSAEVLRDLAFKTDRLRQEGVCDVIIDPGFGFAKTLDQNYRLLSQLEAFKRIGAPVLAGLSRKSMIHKELGVTAEEALNGTTALNMIALLNGADLLRVHDVKEGVETVKLFEAYRRNLPERRMITII